MEFTTRISEADFVNAHELRGRLLKSNAIKYLLYIILAIMIGINLIGLLLHCLPSGSLNSVILPLVPVMLYNFLYLRLYIPYRLRCIYRKDFSGYEDFVQINSDGISEQSKNGVASQYPWSAFELWRESQKVLIVVAKSGIFFIFPKCDLTDDQQTELRGILTQVLPKK